MLLLGTQWATAGTPDAYYIKSDFEKLLIGKRTKLLVDEGQSMNMDEVKAKMVALDAYWQRNNFRIGYTSADHWLKFNLVNDLNEPKNVLLELVNPYLPKVALYIERGEEAIPYEWVKNHRNTQIKFTLQPLDSLNCYLQINPAKQRSSFDLYLWDYEARTVHQNALESTVITSFFLLVLVYMLILGIATYITRFRYFWFYFFYVLFGAFFVFTDLGLSYKFLWINNGKIQEAAIIFITNIYTVFGLFFVRDFFNTQNRRVDKVLLLLIGLLLCFIPFSIYILNIEIPLSYYHTLYKIHGAIYILSCILLIYLLFSSIYRAEENFSGLFLFGFSLHGLSIVINNLQEINFLPEVSIPSFLMRMDFPLTFHTQLPLFLGMLIEMCVVLYIGVIRFRRIYKERMSMAVALADQKHKAMKNLMNGIEVDRKRIAADLHDDIGGRLTLISLQLNAFKQKFQSDKVLDKEIGVVFNSLAEAHAELRNISWNLNPGSLMKFGFIATVKEYIEKTQILNPKMAVNFYCNYDFENVSEFACMSIYRIVYEVINNVNKHSLATELNVQLIDHEDCLLLTIEDNGIGFNVKRVKSKSQGMGMKNLQYRTDSLHGRLDIDSAPGKGTFISIEIPSKAILKTGD